MGNVKLDDWVVLDPNFGRSRAAEKRFVQYALTLARSVKKGANLSDWLEHRRCFLSLEHEVRREDWPTLKAAGLLLTDLAEQGWNVRVRSWGVRVQARTNRFVGIEMERALVRRQELIKRDAQLRQKSIRRFIRSMEQRRLFEGQFVSIFSLMRDGRELAERLKVAVQQSVNGNGHALFEAIEPYVEFVDERKRCKFTGLRLMDIWRYFRHTWTNQYTSVPGRFVMLLVRDAAAPFHPVIGIAALSSPVLQLRERDKWIGWDPDSILETARTHPTKAMAQWLVRTVDRGIEELYVADFIKAGLVTRHLLRHPNLGVIETLMKEGVRERRAHHRFTSRRDYGELRGARHAPLKFWKAKAQTHLFRSKRAYALANLLQARMVFNDWFGGAPTADKLNQLVATHRGQDVIRKVVKKAKARHVGTAMADISVCGAIAPYNAILGGKLVAMLTTSPEVIREYRRRYEGVESEIASSMAGRPITRPAKLVYLGTTSLYGTHSSQYNRVRIPCAYLGGPTGVDVRFYRLGKSESFGTSHYSEDTVEALVSLVQQSNYGQRVNSIFGEGASPKLRKVRDGLDALGLPSHELLQHGRQRIIYGVPLVSNAKEYLLGRQERPRYLVPLDCRDATRRISEWWISRWLRQRIQTRAVLEAVACHTLVQPIRHGARVAIKEERDERCHLFPGILDGNYDER